MATSLFTTLYLVVNYNGYCRIIIVISNADTVYVVVSHNFIIESNFLCGRRALRSSRGSI